jgi:hypothetical protein
MNRRKRLSAETERGKGEQVVFTEDFAGGMGFCTQGEVFFGHAAPVVPHPDSFDTAGINLNFNAGRTGVYGVVEQFPYYRCGAVNNLARGDLSGYFRRKFPDRTVGSGC